VEARAAQGWINHVDIASAIIIGALQLLKANTLARINAPHRGGIFGKGKCGLTRPPRRGNHQPPPIRDTLPAHHGSVRVGRLRKVRLEAAALLSNTEAFVEVLMQEKRKHSRCKDIEPAGRFCGLAKTFGDGSPEPRLCTLPPSSMLLIQHP